MRINGRAVNDPQLLTALVAADGLTGGFIKDSQAGSLPATATNDNAAAGTLGEYIESDIVQGSAVALTSGATANVTSIALTPGDFDVWGNIVFAPAAGTVPTVFIGAIDTTSATLPVAPAKGAFSAMRDNSGFPAGANCVLPIGMRRLSVVGGATAYLLANSTFTVSTMTAYGIIFARRVR